MHEQVAVKKCVATTVSGRDVGIRRRKEGTIVSSGGEEMVHENQNHEDFEVKGGRQRLRHVDGDILFCMSKSKKRTKSRRLRVWMKAKGGGRKELRFIDGDVPRCMRIKKETQKFISKSAGRVQQQQSKKGRQ